MFAQQATLVLLLAVSSLVAGAPLANWRRETFVDKRIVVDPPLTYPNTSAVWYTGQTGVKALWDVPSYTPANYTGTLLLGYLDRNDTTPDEHLFSTPLSTGFDLTAGTVTFDIPCDTNIKSRATYILVLMGDSGNKGAEFTIHRNATACPNFQPKKPKTSTASPTATVIPASDS
ncbi:MAG: hypothetical protein CYPHOPRED_000232 [Cyphobasidiales sp. Tagirdzhanova-0007]|nr:MAG: hypothetical protein CYPHOPRED_000232 [Cyphobasidiales sp. Tagirdzhanova-0007]